MTTSNRPGLFKQISETAFLNPSSVALVRVYRGTAEEYAKKEAAWKDQGRGTPPWAIIHLIGQPQPVLFYEKEAQEALIEMCEQFGIKTQ